MSLNLLSGYGSDDDEIEETGQSDLKESSIPKNERTNVSDKEDSNQETKSYFFGGEGSSSEDDDVAATSTASNLGTTKKCDTEDSVKPRLPSLINRLRSKHVGSSVFVSDHQREEQQHNATLSQHVALTETDLYGKTTQVCRGFLKGKCRRGAKCRYLHPKIEPVKQDRKNTVAIAASLYKGETDEVPSKKVKH